MDTQKTKRSAAQQLQSGQAIVMMALMMLGLMSILGLAIDGGGLFFLYRDTQNATDAAVIAATYARCTSEIQDVVEFAGREAAARNGFDNNASSNWVTVNNPPLNGTGTGDDQYVEVMISAVKPAYFIQLVYRDPLQVTSRAVGRCQPPFEPSTVPALMALGTGSNCEVNITGSDNLLISDPSAMHSNNGVHVSGSNSTIDGGVSAVGGVHQTGSGNTNYLDGYQTGVEMREDPLGGVYALREFAPGGRIWENAAIKTEINEGGTWRPSGVINGLYYVHGDVHINSAVVGPDGITIAATGQIQFSSGADLRYHAGGFLLVSGAQTGCGSKAIRFSGSSIRWMGVVYAPLGAVDVSGSNNNIIGAVIAQSVDFSGSDNDIIYDPDLLDPIPASVVISE